MNKYQHFVQDYHFSLKDLSTINEFSKEAESFEQPPPPSYKNYFSLKKVTSEILSQTHTHTHAQTHTHTHM